MAKGEGGWAAHSALEYNARDANHLGEFKLSHVKRGQTAMALFDKGEAKPKNGGDLGFESKLWAAADALRNNMDAAEYKHVVLGLILLKYISDAFEAKHAELETQRAEGPTPKTRTSIAPPASSGCQRKPAGLS
jgi:HsdM N-terminal domain